MKNETKAIFKKYRVDVDYGEYGMAKNSLESDLYKRVIHLEQQLEKEREEKKKDLIDILDWAHQEDFATFTSEEMVEHYLKYTQNQSKDE